ncbi:33 kDa chaperonin [invertebrate metagenome]|uniref:33 kDa chaperonin n=1 Tax=invertebrate metagenome TaxID=1711999 RepID=A0A2H9T778_9ZZZZ
MISTDSVRRFLFENNDIRGEWVSLHDSFDQAVAAHDYPLVVRELLGELVSAAILLSSTLKFDGLMTLQAKSDGAISLLMVECTQGKTFRALARFPEEQDIRAMEKKDLLGNGKLVFTIDPDQGQRHQGIIPLEGGSLSDSLEQYFSLSEQLPTRFWLASDGHQCTGFMIQALPASLELEEEDREESWTRITALAATVIHEELLVLSCDDVLHRLYHEEDIRLFDGSAVCFHCNCSQDRSARIIESLGKEEADAIISEQGEITMNCQFCNKQYVFSARETETIFSHRTAVLH